MPLKRTSLSEVSRQVRRMRDESDVFESDEGAVNEYRFSVAGVTFDGRQQKIDDVARRIHDGEALSAQLIRQPDNRFDPNAIEVVILDQQIGYVPKRLAARLAPMLDSGQTARVQSVEFYESYRGSSGCRIQVQIPSEDDDQPDSDPDE